MHFSESDMRLVARLEKREQSWLRWRWAGLLGAFILLGDGLYAFLLLQKCFREPDVVSTLYVSVLLPTAYSLVALGAGLLFYIFSRWSGKAETRLLLRLIEGTQKNGD